jgi:hypothetical protein
MGTALLAAVATPVCLMLACLAMNAVESKLNRATGHEPEPER